MYHEHFGLKEAPFRITPHTEFFFAGAKRGATLEALIYAITREEGIVKVSGEVGSGKTMLCRMLMERLPQSVETVYLANPLLSHDDIVYAIADDLHVELPQDRSSAILRRLQEHLIARYAQGRQVVLLVDEAHAMPAQTLEKIRLLSNLESGRHKLLQIVLFGQPELDEVLDRPEMRQLKDRITHHFSLEPLVRSDVAAYIDFRMRAAGYRGPEVFDAAALRQIARASCGLTRRINILADKALLAAFAAGRHRVGKAQAKAALRDARLRARGRLLPWLGAGTAALTIGAAVVLLPRMRPTEPAASAATAGTSASAAPEPAVRPPPSPAADPAPHATPPALELARTDTAAGTPTPPPSDSSGHWSPVTRSHLAQTAGWLPAADDDHWFLQLLTSDADDALAVEEFLVQAAGLLDDRQLRAYEARVGPRRRLGVIYGDYASLAEAQAALAQLPAGLGSYGAYPRQVRRLR